MSFRIAEKLGSNVGGMADWQDHILALVFLHDASADFTPVVSPFEARWETLLALPDDQLGAGVDASCEACFVEWPEALEGFFDRCRFADQPVSATRSAMRQVAKLEVTEVGSYFTPTSRLGDVHAATRSLSAKQSLGAFFTPSTIANFLGTLASAAPGDFVLDPACGAGALLIGAFQTVRDEHGPEAARTLTLLGVELDARTAQIARASLILAGVDRDAFFIGRGNALAQPLVGRDRSDGQLKTIEAHCVVGNPPFGGKVTNAELEEAAANGPLVIPDRVLYREMSVTAETAAALEAAVGDTWQRAAAEPVAALTVAATRSQSEFDAWADQWRDAA